VLVAKTLRAAAVMGRSVVAVSGGVGCNSRLREKLRDTCAAGGLKLLLAEPSLCTDNAAMIAHVAMLKFARLDFSALTIDIDPNLRLVA
jgi:N6-L-threonylcarbamoyladenine synthase